MKKKPKRPPLNDPTKEDYQRMAALRICGNCSGRGDCVFLHQDGSHTKARCLECDGKGTIER